MASEWEHNHLRQTDEHIRAAKSYICREERLIERLNRTWMWTSGYNGHIRRATHGYEPTDGGVREELAAGVKGVDRPAGGSIQNDSGLPQGPAGASGAT